MGPKQENDPESQEEFAELSRAAFPASGPQEPPARMPGTVTLQPGIQQSAPWEVGVGLL